MTTAYYDTSYLLKLQLMEVGSAEVLSHACTVDVIFCSLHGRAEFVSACHRKVRERQATLIQLQAMLAQTHADTAAGALKWLPVTESLIEHVEHIFSTAPLGTFLRAADAMHLACAAGHGFTEIYSNDRHLLAAAPLFGLVGVNRFPMIEKAQDQHLG